ncbi:MAG: hypothetical protein QN155_07730 [Armatimonadota bacterium]|nr:hypothetical protein [Armatimonadota bacterium]MDR7404565.1 hypothetical protein [Armatimonadota bacterium]
MRVWSVVVLALLSAACARTMPSATLVEYRDAAGISVQYPAGWQARIRGDATWLVPADTPGDAEPAEFIVIAARPTGGPPTDAIVRREVFGLLPIHGVSGFQPDSRSPAAGLWYKFEVTGSAGERQWAAVGAVAAGTARLVIVACAKPLERWRDGQKECDAAIRSLQPGPLD